MPQTRTGDWMQTYTGRQFWPLDPRPEEVDPRDIAHALAYQCRYNGMTREHYSVAEHCLLMSWAVPVRDQLHALLHDATEAYIGDMIRPLKNHVPAFRDIEDVVWKAIAERFGISAQIPSSVHDADIRICLDERAALLSEPPAPWDTEALGTLGVDIGPLPAQEAERRYLDRLYSLLVREDAEPAWA
ncbi:hypothetical protein CHO01_36970 [Cellulomonas hominis]|uniref:Phosphohydrolase n=1 Tax=Cellulomonas hominis TaxID=156981 RepID=A0A511FH98_9CELL|nr:phosphohydrolase [Cellulomonas hominis]MBB5474717.1 hypothetical protein [Cellulomonas hominis]NKY05982.1 phosphohydrolase [Cellulomonas hominis]GEL48581.1 hypothetical protein CHO01_36970 [Cellulomonas hominis]